MATIAKNREIAAPIDNVWQILVDWENETKYWSNERDIRIVTSDSQTIEREATVGPRAFAQKTRQKIILDPKKSIKLSLQGDHITGERIITLAPTSNDKTRIDVAWNLELKELPGFVEGIVKNQISKATEAALRKIAEAATDQSSTKA